MAACGAFPDYIDMQNVTVKGDHLLSEDVDVDDVEALFEKEKADFQISVCIGMHREIDEEVSSYQDMMILYRLRQTRTFGTLSRAMAEGDVKFPKLMQSLELLREECMQNRCDHAAINELLNDCREVFQNVDTDHEKIMQRFKNGENIEDFLSERFEVIL
ncbi:unnamed protein product [Caenorhabditis bovis]|uniref:Uncharacterized protein n=1 Tax=Caenorhabditis bovis TaxID=2654633 RepID=A0A8S1FCA2_9PELO|nr:unnamed protein product [Caenorhabditis bovis]